VDAVALDAEGLADMGEVEVVVERCGGPDAARFDAAVGVLGSMLEGRCATLRERQAQIGEQGRLIVFDGEDVMGVAPV